MQLLKEISDKDINSFYNIQAKSYELRKASRAIVLNDLGQIALLFVSKNNYHKLPGGGIEEGENIEKALVREIKEEVGAEIEVLGEIGAVIEYRNEHEFLQISYCFCSKVKGTVGDQAFTDDEIQHGFELKWVDLNQSIELMKNDQPNNYVGKFIQARDLEFLKRAYEKLTV